MTVIVLVLALLLPASSPARELTAVAYRQLPREVVDATWYPWRGDGPLVIGARTQNLGADRALSLRGNPGESGVVVMRARNGTYLIDGPFDWPEHDGTRRVVLAWRYSVRGAAPRDAGGMNPPLEWMPADGRAGELWPRCGWRDSVAWECWGVPVGDAGVVAAAASGHVWWAAVSDVNNREALFRSNAWGRLLVIRRHGGQPLAHAKVAVMRLVAPSALRMRAIRLLKAPLETAATVSVGSSTWVAGGPVPGSSWVEVHADGCAPAYLALEELSAGAHSSPVFVRLEDDRAVEGSLRGPGGQPVAGAFVTLFRLVDPPVDLRMSKVKPRRVSEAETQTDGDGHFGLSDVGSESYEVVAWHPQLGRVSHMLDPADTRLDLRIDAPALVGGRVLIGGRPAAGVDVKSQPDAAAFLDADDFVDVKGGDGITGSDGRFSVALAPSGGGELRIGGGALPSRRVPLPHGAAASIDLGDIELGSSLKVRIVLDQDPGCELRAIGPVGRLGLHVLQPTRVGPGLFDAQVPEAGTWSFALFCGNVERPLLPATVAITAETRTVQIAVR